MHQTLDADITGHVQKSLRVGKRDSRQCSFTSSCTIVSCDLQYSCKKYPWVTCHSLQLLMAGVDYGIQVKVSVWRGLGRGRIVCWAAVLEKGWGGSRKSLHEPGHLEKSRTCHQPGVFIPWLCVGMYLHVCTSSHEAQHPTCSTMGREDGAAELWVCPTCWIWQCHREKPIL